MCPTPKPIYEFGGIIMEHLVNQQFDLVNEEIKCFKEKGYIIYYRTISREEYESSHFIENAGKIMQEAKESSKGWKYNGILVFYPFINKKNYRALFMEYRSSPFPIIFGTLFDWSVRFNEDRCLSNPIINLTDKVCEDTNIYLMVFYFKVRLNWK